MSQEHTVTVTYPDGTPYTRDNATCDGCRPAEQGGGNGVHIVPDASTAAAEVIKAAQYGLTAIGAPRT